MRYAACTEADLQYLRSRVAGRGPNKPCLASEDLRYVSVITGRNAQYDQLNEMGHARFAQEAKKKLHYFYSHDVWGSEDQQGKSKKKSSNQFIESTISDSTQEVLWSIPPKNTDNIPGILPLCIGMPDARDVKA